MVNIKIRITWMITICRASPTPAEAILITNDKWPGNELRYAVPASSLNTRVSIQPVSVMITTSSIASPSRLIGQLANKVRLSGATLAPIDIPIRTKVISRTRGCSITGTPAMAAMVTANAPPISHPAGR